MALTKLIQVAMDQEDYERWDKGLPPRKKQPKKVFIPKPLEVKDLLFADTVKQDDIKSATAKRDKRHNEEGVIFTGFLVTIDLMDGKRKTGWMDEGEFYKFRRRCGDKMVAENIGV
jgi:hypothetical protein